MKPEARIYDAGGHFVLCAPSKRPIEHSIGVRKRTLEVLTSRRGMWITIAIPSTTPRHRRTHRLDFNDS